MKTEDVKFQLKSICIEFIEFMNILKKNEIITKEEYDNYIFKKTEFLNKFYA